MDTARSASGHGQTRLAVFDFDGTCIDGQSGLLFAEYLFRKGYLSVPQALKLAWWGFRYKFHLPYRQEEARETIFQGLDRYDADEVNDLMRQFHDEVLTKRYRPLALEEIRRRKAEGCVTLLVSATFLGIAVPAFEHLGADVLVATEMEKDDRGHFTGRVMGPVIAGREKPRAVAKWADEHLGRGAWRIAYAYGDHHSDEYLLEGADVPVAVSPGKTLRAKAEKRGWRIVDWSLAGPAAGADNRK